MLEYLLALGIRGIVREISQYLSDKELEREFTEACEEHERVCGKLMIALNNEKKMSKLVACFDNSKYKKNNLS